MLDGGVSAVLTCSGTGMVMAIQVGQKMPAGVFRHRTADGVKELTTETLFTGKKVVLVSVPGAFTPTCSTKHLPGFLQEAEAFRAKGVDTLAFMAVNDAFVMDAWGRDQAVGDKIIMLADGLGEYTRALGMEMDLSAGGLGMRGRRFAVVVDDGTVTHVAAEERPGVLDASSAASVLASL